MREAARASRGRRSAEAAQLQQQGLKVPPPPQPAATGATPRSARRGGTPSSGRRVPDSCEQESESQTDESRDLAVGDENAVRFQRARISVLQQQVELDFSLCATHLRPWL